MKSAIHRTSLCFFFGAIVSALPNLAYAQPSFVNWESPHVSPVDMTPDGAKLLVVNTADNRLEVFDISSGTPSLAGSVPVGLDPVSVRALDDSTVWVVNHISDSVSIVDLGAMNVVRTLRTLDEPTDVAFAGTPRRAFVSCSQANAVMVFDPDSPAVLPTTIPIEGEDPRAMAVSADGSQVYVAIFESGNKTTILGGGSTINNGFPPNVVNSPLGPYGGVNPPPNDGLVFTPPMKPGNPSPPAVGMIVRKDSADQWLDDNSGNWTDLVSGANAVESGRQPGWDLPDHDVAVIDTTTLAVTYASGLMNACMAISVHPTNGIITVVGTEATNEIRFEPVLNGRFIRVNIGGVDPVTLGTVAVIDLNPHLTYLTPTIPQAGRDQSLGDPRGIVWNTAGTRAYITGMGSNNLVVIDAAGAPAGLQPTIEVGEGPTGIVLDEARQQLYVVNKFDGSISVVDAITESETLRVPFFDPSPPAIKLGRKHLYDTRKNSGLGHTSCGSCHIDARFDRLAWDLGNPAGDVKTFNQNCSNGLLGNCQNWHPMKGPMTTQTLQDIIGKEPHHWRGDRNGIEEFNGAFLGLLGDDINLTPVEMQQFEDFLATITFPPNPFREFDNALPANLPLPGHFTIGRFAPPGLPLGPGDALRGLDLYRLAGLDGVNCVACHTLPTGIGSNLVFVGGQFVPFPVGPNGELHHSVIGLDGSTNVSMKTPHLRNLYDKVGFETTQLSNLAGFGYFHDGSIDSIARFVGEPVFSVTSDQDIADLVAFMLAFSGSDLPLGTPQNPGELLGPMSKDTQAAVGIQITLVDEAIAPPGRLQLIADMIGLADAGAVGLVVKGVQASEQRGYAYVGGGLFQSDRFSETFTAVELRALATPGSELTYTVVPLGTETRIGIDRDLDGFLDRDEIDGCSNPADPTSVPPLCTGSGACCDASGIAGCSNPVSQTACIDSGGTYQGDGTTCEEICDGIDNNCDGVSDEGFGDPDGDGWGTPCDNCPTVSNPGQEDSDNDGIGDACDGMIVPPLPATDYPHGATKNRYISFVPANADVNTINLLFGYQVTHEDSGESWFISTPRTDGTSPGSISGLGLTYLVSDSTPPLFAFATLPVVHVGGCMIMPGERYSVRSTIDGITFSPSLNVQTAAIPTNGRWWADIVGAFTIAGDSTTIPRTPPNAWTPPNLIMNGFDIVAILRGFDDVSAPHLSWVDINAEIPDRVANGNDVLRAVNAFAVGSGREFYPFNVPNSPGPQGQGACSAPPLEADMIP